MSSSIEEEDGPAEYSRNEPMAKSARDVLRHRGDIRAKQGSSLM